MDEPKKGKIFAEGKTKRFYEVEGDDFHLIAESKDDITKNDNPDETRQMSSKAKLATITTCEVFELLKKAGIPVAYEKQLSEKEFLAVKSEMIPLEVIARRYAVGSYLKRYPNFAKKKGEAPHRFHRLVFELFLKTTGGKFVGKDGISERDMPIDEETGRPIDDPFILNPKDEEWVLRHPKVPEWDAKSNLNISIFRTFVLSQGITVEKIKEITRKIFLVLEGAWSQLNCRLIDFKIEFGIDKNGNLVVADVIDNDSWRLRDSNWDELSKQLFRDNADMENIADKYALVANLVKKFHIPKQALVLWRGSKDDKLPDVPLVAGVEKVEVVKSGHKEPENCLPILEEVLGKYPEGGAILALVGMSNGLGPILATRTSWPVISVPLTVKEKPHDVWSSLEMPSNVPNATILSPKNAVLATLNVLAQKNPVAYMHRQYAIEELVV
jgi:phosphoribosylaminoimidazole carboxylase / phosphoribosylaminoimidazole-succinocarboxamide synthase